ncbi:hypothetical protein BOTNAR_0048g00120 [Botryotinia narcissicola]|uniref:BTB domain-containing protein n=1 Tax=Botryotinia narcissicola TaxID=278944 RepID=A0A4Z1J690_9HELO|nr:hypothetical protein BOTNAR_0048g00120 [Botryotinia narcissicola]
MSLKRSRSSSPAEQQLDIQEQKDPFEGLKTTFSDTLGTEVIQIAVGENDDQKTFHIHKKLLCDRIPHFAQLLEDSHKSIIEFPEAHPNTFDVLMEWVHTDRLRAIFVLDDENDENATTYLHRSWSTESLYPLADDLSLPELMDRVMDVERRFECSQSCFYMPEEIKFIYDTVSKNSKLRKYIAELTAYTLRNKGKDLRLSTAQLLSAMENEDFALDYLETSRRFNIKDPRTGPGCRFHVHGKNEKCTAKDYCSEGKVTALSIEELKKKIASPLKKQRLS